MKMNSICTFIRRQLKIKGATEHNGRGVYEMDYDCSYEELRKKIDDKVAVWQQQNLIELVDEDDNWISVKFVEQMTEGGYYRSFALGKKHHHLGVLF
jgi:hypothetical protein